MFANVLRFGFCLEMLLAVQSAAWGNDSDIPETQPGVARPAQFATPVPAAPMQGPYWAPGGDIYTGLRTGSPYYWSASNYGAYGPAAYGPGYGYGGYGASPAISGGYGYGPAAGGWNTGYGSGYSYGAGRGYYGGVYGGSGYGGMDPYTYHFGPGFYRNGGDVGSYRFPYYSYRRPWYTPGPASYNRDTNMPW